VGKGGMIGVSRGSGDFGWGASSAISFGKNGICEGKCGFETIFETVFQKPSKPF